MLQNVFGSKVVFFFTLVFFDRAVLQYSYKNSERYCSSVLSNLGANLKKLSLCYIKPIKKIPTNIPA